MKHRDCEAPTERGVCLEHCIGPYQAHCELDAEPWPCSAKRAEAALIQERDAALARATVAEVEAAELRKLVVRQESLGWQDEYRFWHCDLCGGMSDTACLREPDLSTLKHDASCILATEPGERGAAVLEAVRRVVSAYESFERGMIDLDGVFHEIRSMDRALGLRAGEANGDAS